MHRLAALLALAAGLAPGAGYPSIAFSAPPRSRRTGSPIPEVSRASATARSRRSRRRTSRTWNCNGCSRRIRSRSSKPRRWWSTASCTRCRRPNDVVALDAVTGRVFWMYSYTPCQDARPCCGRVNRGVAMLGDTLFMGTIDAHLIAIDAKTGKPLWNIASGRSGGRLRDHARAAGDQGQSDRRRGGRRVRHSRLHRGLRRQDRQGSLALLHHPRNRRARQRDLGGRFLAARRRIRSG